jgi:hypothetical protein
VNTGQFPDADTQDILVAQPNRDRETLETIELLCRTIWATRQGWGCQTVLFHDRQARHCTGDRGVLACVGSRG